jgi:large conductance mechanosensitive channel
LQKLLNDIMMKKNKKIINKTKMKKKEELGIRGFKSFIDEQGVVGLAVGFILGGAISKVVSALVTDIINPIIGAILGTVGDFRSAYFSIGSAQILYGDLISVTIDFLVIALVVYFGVKALKLDEVIKGKIKIK